MISKEKVEEVKQKPSTIIYDYMFNYFGRDKFKDKIITGTSILVAIKAYKNGIEIKFTETPIINGINKKRFEDNYKVSFNSEKLYIIEKNLIIDNLFRLEYGWDKIDFEIVGFELDYEVYPGFMETLEVSQKEFETFLQNHVQDFNIDDNFFAQVPSFRCNYQLKIKGE